MYIKIKHIKKLLLISACVFFAGFNYLTYVKADSTTGGIKTCDKAIDNDCDGLINTEEALYGTNANNTDSDGDGYSDGVEIKSGYDPMKAAPGDRLVPNQNNVATLESRTTEDNTASLTDSYIKDINSFIASKNGTPISAEDMRNFSDSVLADKAITTSTDTLPDFDKTQLKVLSQTYAALSKEDRQQKIQQDSAQYLYQILYLLISNAPATIATPDDLSAFQEDFETRLSDLANTDNMAYFSDMGNRLEVFSGQLNDVQVPETMVDLHIKFVRIIKGFLSLSDTSISADINDPLGKIVLLTKARELTIIFADFLVEDFSNYFKELSSN